MAESGKHPLDQYPDDIANCPPNPPPREVGEERRDDWLKSHTDDGIMFVPPYESGMGADAWIIVRDSNLLESTLKNV